MSTHSYLCDWLVEFVIDKLIHCTVIPLSHTLVHFAILMTTVNLCFHKLLYTHMCTIIIAMTQVEDR